MSEPSETGQIGVIVTFTSEAVMFARHTCVLFAKIIGRGEYTVEPGTKPL